MEPTAFSESSILALLRDISLPVPLKISYSKTQGTNHSIYNLEYSPEALSAILSSLIPPPPQQPLTPHAYNPTTLILRISNPDLPRRKTENECAILACIRRKAPSVPVPVVVRYSSSCENALGAEFQILTLLPGRTVDQVFRTWSEDGDEKGLFLDQVAALLEALHGIEVDFIGGFQFGGESGEEEGEEEEEEVVVGGPLCEEFLWRRAGIEKFWHVHDGLVDELPETLNAQGPFATWSLLNAAWLRKYIYAIERHPFLQLAKDLVPGLTALAKMLEGEEEEKEEEEQTDQIQAWKLDEMRVVVAHRDLHLGNILWDEGTKQISGVIDWEFAGAAPFCKWDPPKAFLASTPFDDADALLRKRKWVQDFKDACAAKGRDWKDLVWDREGGTAWKSRQQEWLFNVVDYTRCICEVGPTGEKSDRVMQWKGFVIDNLKRFNIS
jgi:hypothetical protein